MTDNIALHRLTSDLRNQRRARARLAQAFYNECGSTDPGLCAYMHLACSRHEWDNPLVQRWSVRVYDPASNVFQRAKRLTNSPREVWRAAWSWRRTIGTVRMMITPAVPTPFRANAWRQTYWEAADEAFAAFAHANARAILDF